MREKRTTYSPELYLDIEKEHNIRPERVTLCESIKGTHKAIVTILNSNDKESKKYIETIFRTTKPIIEASWIYDDLDDEYKAKIDLRRIPSDVCQNLISIARKIINESKKAKKVVEKEEQPVANDKQLNITYKKYVEAATDKEGLQIKESVLGTNKAIVNIFTKSSDEELKNSILKILTRYALFDEKVEYDDNAYDRTCLIDLKAIPTSICKKIKQLSRQLNTELANQEREKKNNSKAATDRETKSYLESLNKFKKR